MNTEDEGRSKMKRTMVCVVALVNILLLSNGTSHAVTGLGIGLRIGRAKVDDPNTGESMDGVTMFGAQLKIGTLPIIDLEASAEYARKKYSYSYSVAGQDLIEADVTYHHVSLNGSAKYNLSVAISPIKPYLGAGLGMHFMSSSVNLPGVAYEIPLDTDYSESKTGAHVLGGLLLSFPLFPLELFAEGRYSVIFTEDESSKETSLYGGFTFKLP